MPASFEAEIPLADAADADLLPPPEQPGPPLAEAIAPPPVPVEPPASQPPASQPPASQPPLPGGVYVAQSGDSWWSLAEQAYGDGRLYRALFAWNRAIDPRVTLAPGTRLEIPPTGPLGAAWPALLPRD
jgi:5'-nucleotidase/UDP-sugar diphosphatase